MDLDKHDKEAMELLTKDKAQELLDIIGEKPRFLHTWASISAAYLSLRANNISHKDALDFFRLAAKETEVNLNTWLKSAGLEDWWNRAEKENVNGRRQET